MAVVVLAAGCNKAFDFTGDGKADVVWLDQATGSWYRWDDLSQPNAQPTLVFTSPDWPAPGDYDGSGRYTTGVQSNAGWVTGGGAGTLVWPLPSGAAGSLWRVPAAYDGAHKTLPAYFRDTDDMWFVFGHDPVQLGSGRTGHSDEDMPVPADYDGDGITDLATYNPWTSNWIVRFSHDLSIHTGVLGGGAAGYPTAGDFDGDGRAQRAWVSWSGVWTIEGHASVSVTQLQSQTTLNDFGVLPAVADYDGDGKDDIAGAFGTTGSMWMWRAGIGSIPLPVPATTHVAIPVDSHLEYVVQIARLTLLYRCQTGASTTGCPT